MRFSKKLLKKVAGAQQKRLEIQKSGRRDKEPNLKGINESLNQLFLFEKLKNYCAYLSYKKMVSRQLLTYEINDFQVVEGILISLRQESQLPPIIEIYYQLSLLYQGLDKEKEDIEREFYKLLQIEQLINGCQIDREDLIEIYSNLTNYCTYQNNHGHNDFMVKNLLYNQHLLELEYNTESKGVINSGAYKNFVTLLLKASETLAEHQIGQYLPQNYANIFDWALDFVETYKERLDEVDRKKYYQYSKGLIFFYRQQYLKAFCILKNLTRVREIFVSQDIKMLQLQVYLELEIQLDKHFEESGIEISRILDSFRDQLKQHNNPKIGYHLDYYLLFHKTYVKFYSFFLKHAWEYKGGKAYNAKLNRLNTHISTISYSYKSWFLEKLEEIT